MTVTNPSVIPPEEAALRRKLDRLQAELRQYKELAARQDEQLRNLQKANEAAYRDQYDAASGPHFCTAHPFGQPLSRKSLDELLDDRAATETDPARRAAWRLLRRSSRSEEDAS